MAYGIAGSARANRRRVVRIWLVTVLFTTGCGFIQSIFSPAGSNQGKFIVDPQFAEFYQRLGGDEILGPAITPLFWEEFIKKQYVEAGLMIYDALSAPNYYLAPLGHELGFSASSTGGQDLPSNFSEYSIYESFIPLYSQLGGEAVVGRPVTDVQFNPEKKRIEQHFENLGFYQLIDDANGAAYLLAYGVNACDISCPYTPQDSAIIERGINLSEPFASAVNFLGIDFVGKRLAGPHIADDGNNEIIFENIVLYVDPKNSGRVIARPIIEYIGFAAHNPGKRLDTDTVVFFMIEDGLGYNIPVKFNDYLAQHGGLSIAGYPISELFPLEDGVFRQCFANLCLDYYTNRDDHSSIVVAPLGSIYKSYTIRSDGDARILDIPTAPAEVQLMVREEYAFITSQQEQIIYVSILDKGIPLVGVEPRLTLTLPDGTQSVFRFPSSDENGVTFIAIPAILATNGTLVFYEICIDHAGTGIACAQENYLIWGNP
jgi:hypothetical protein